MWKFDKEVADRFETEAINNIPDYHRVIDMCVDIAKQKGFSSEINVVDVGSALGFTVDRFINADYPYTYGVESSADMIEKSLHKDKIFLSNTFPVMPVEFVMANWTLHFVKERKQYIQDIYNNMTGGVFILSEKTTQTKEVKELYYNFKIANGVSLEYIKQKEQLLQGFMDLYPVDWYIQTLNDVRFKNIQIINARYGFVTFYCEK
jgi:hypothetical protein